MLKNIWQKLCNVILPTQCLICGLNQELLCNNCLSKLPRLKPTDWPKLAGLDLTISTLPYQAINKILSAYKYAGSTELAKPLSKLLANYLNGQITIPTNSVIIPLPSHPRRIRERGFDHIQLITKELGKLTNLPALDNILIREKYTPHQVKLNRQERLKNLNNCFKLKNPELLDNKTIILVDDVTTTGTSLTEATKTLRQTKIEKIIGLTLAYESLTNE